MRLSILLLVGFVLATCVKINQGMCQDATSSARQGQVKIEADDYQIPIIWDGLAMIVPVEVNGHPLRLLLDSGFEDNLCIFRSTLKALQLKDDDRLGHKTAFYGLGGLADADDFRVSTVKIGDSPLWHDVTIHVLDNLSDRYDGILGIGCLGTLGRIDLDFQHGKVIVHSGVSNAQLTEEAQNHPSAADSDRPLRLTLPFELLRGDIIVPFRAGGKDVSVVFDTGSYLSNYRTDSVQSLKRIAECPYGTTGPIKSVLNNESSHSTSDMRNESALGLGKNSVNAKVFSGVYAMEAKTQPGPLLLFENMRICTSSGAESATDEFFRQTGRHCIGYAGMSLFVQFDKVCIDYTLHQLILEGDRFGNLVYFPNGGLQIRYGDKKPQTVIPGTVIDELWNAGALQSPISRNTDWLPTNPAAVMNTAVESDIVNLPSSHWTCTELPDGGSIDFYDVNIPIVKPATLFQYPYGVIMLVYREVLKN